MRLLLDTHALLWFFEKDPALSDIASGLIHDPSNLKHIRIISFWEIAIKQRLNKLQFDVPLPEFHRQVLDWGAVILPVTIQDIAVVKELPLFHRDPFDRLLIAQAHQRNLSLVTKDNNLYAYGVPTLW